jgi:magnesium-transporting ATPase (P-type)
MLTGDNEASAARVARKLGIAAFNASLRWRRQAVGAGSGWVHPRVGDGQSQGCPRAEAFFAAPACVCAKAPRFGSTQAASGAVVGADCPGRLFSCCSHMTMQAFPHSVRQAMCSFLS